MGNSGSSFVISHRCEVLELEDGCKVQRLDPAFVRILALGANRDSSEDVWIQAFALDSSYQPLLTFFAFIVPADLAGLFLSYSSTPVAQWSSGTPPAREQ